ncbi:MAG TPA: hypothetical protein VFI14_10815 [Chryseosolibacter sp.]|jgi:hypothetical protein|nr:hypothetical protein [Chryseosolibacter sp.]
MQIEIERFGKAVRAWYASVAKMPPFSQKLINETIRCFPYFVMHGSGLLLLSHGFSLLPFILTALFWPVFNASNQAGIHSLYLRAFLHIFYETHRMA